MPCDDCSRAENCPPCVNETEPKGSTSSSPDERCVECGCTRSQHMGKPQGCLRHGFHTFVPAEPEHRQCRCWESDAEGDVCCECSKKMCEGCAHASHGDDPCGAEGCLCGHEVPEPEAPESGCPHCGADHAWEQCAAYEEAVREDSRPPRRPPYAVAYVLQDGTHFEVALPGDATVGVFNGALIITHKSSPVQGLTQARPMEAP